VKIEQKEAEKSVSFFEKISVQKNAAEQQKSFILMIEY